MLLIARVSLKANELKICMKHLQFLFITSAPQGCWIKIGKGVIYLLDKIVIFSVSLTV